MADGSAHDDATLVKQARMGSTLAFGTLVERYERGARVVAIRATTDHHSADDAVQQAFVKAFERLSTLRDDSCFGGWLMRIVAREACSLASKRKQHVELHDDMLAVSECESSDLDAELRLIVQLLGKLPDHEQVVVHLHYLNNMSAREVARVTGRPIGTVTKQLSRAVGRLRDWMEQEEVTR